MSSVFTRLADALEHAENDWSVIARPNQLPPPGMWLVWLLLAGRGFGKTRTIVEWARMQVESGAARRIAIVAATAADVRDVLVEGPAGFLAVSPEWNRPVYEPTKRRLTWHNGAIATCYSADEPDRLRGPQHDAAICDELAAWRYPEAWDMLQFGLRLGKHPRCVVATTPRPVKILLGLIAREGRDVVITRGGTLENARNLAPTFITQMRARYGGTRLGRQELDGEMLDDVPGALWTRETIEASRVDSAPQHQQRVVIGIDPAGSTNEGADVTGIVAAAIGADGEAYVLADLSGRYAPTDWARRAIACYHSLRADKIVIERNFGGDMAKATLASVDAGVPVKEVNSSRGKVLRAEPIASLFEQKRAHLVGTLPELEDQMAAFTADWDRARDGSPDRVDAMVFALTELMLGQPQGGFFRDRSLLTNGEPLGDMPFPRGCFAVIGTPARSGPQDNVSVVYFALHMEDRPLYVIDYEQYEIDGDSLDSVLVGIQARLDTLRTECKCGPEGGIWIEETPIGGALLGQGTERGYDVYNLDEKVALPADLAARANAAARFIATGKHVKITRAAYEKQTTFRGVTRNHLMAQYLGFSGSDEPNNPAELFNALCVAAIITFGGVQTAEDK